MKATTKYPIRYPNTICMYENWLVANKPFSFEKLATDPGIEMKVIPDKEAPIIPNATTYQGDFRFPRKKAEFSSFPEVNLAIRIKTRK